MKTIIYIVLILLLLPIFIKAQTTVTGVNFNLNSQATDYNIYKARDYIKLSNGFTTTGQNFKAEIDESLVYPVNYVTAPTNPSAYNIDENLTVGAIPGQINVSQSGGAIYNIPIDLPAGTAGVQPQLSLVYNSQGNKGILGWKWDLAGISAITRTGQNLYFDNNTSNIVNSPDYTSGNSFDDRFNLDGNRLILNSGNYGEVNSTYKKENDDLSTIEYLGKYNGFLVITKDGIKIYYGNTTDSRLLPVYWGVTPVPVVWKINRIEDRFGNYMNYIYTSASGENVIAEIDYTGNTNANLSCYNKVKFYYQNKVKDKFLYYIYGTKVVSEKILRKICVESSNTLINTYEFEYAEDFYTKLVKVNKSGLNGEKLNPTVIYYGTGGEAPLKIETSQDGQFQYFPPLTTTMEYFPTDFNGDGYTDIVGLEFYYAYHNDIPQRKIYTQMFLKQNTKDMVYGLNGLPPTISLGTGYEMNLKEGTLPNSLGFSKADFNGDGIEDLLMYKTLLEDDPYSSPGSVNQKINEVKILLGSKTNPYSQSIIKTNAFELINEGAYFGVHYRSKLVTGDFDGDGNADFIILEYVKMRQPNPSYTPYYSSKVLFFSPSKNQRTIINTYGTSINDCIANFFRNNELKDLNVSDINGNKKNEIIYTFIYQTSPEIIGIRAFELNDAGDAFNLILNEPDENSYYISFENFHTADMNNDGYTDIISNQPFNTGDPVEHRIYYSKGYNINWGGFNSITTVKFGFNDAGNPDANENLMFIGDVNGDGYPDIINPISHNILANLLRVINIGASTAINLQRAGILEQYSYTLTRASFIPGDFNGDGKLDFLYPRDGMYGLQYRIAYINSYKSDMYVNNIKDGFANETNIYNMPLTNDSIYFQSATYNEFNVAPIFCTYRIQQNNNNSFGNSIIYKYNDGVYFKERKAFGGFKYSSSHNLKNDIITETTYSKDFGNSYSGLLPINSTSKLFTSNQQLSSSTNIYQFHGGVSDKAFRISISEIKEYNSLNKVTQAFC